MSMINIHINIGSNINRRKNISLAIGSLRLVFSDLKFSSLYSSPAEGFEGNDFFNIGVNASTNLSVTETIYELHKIESVHGRDREQEKFSSRIIDLDLVLYGDMVHPEVNVPRDDVLKYAFVLAPVSELNSQLLHPIEKQSYLGLWEAFQSENKFSLIKYNADRVLE
ncbi:MAG: 2-amino-4-hydroxy-6-hydroxymethyldihydropteridine diphosphokinase [PS1 clade bacterium]